MQYLAHRGFAGRYPENTLQAFRATLDTRNPAVAGIELDVQLLADGELAVFHDTRLWRLARRPGRLASRTSAVLPTLPLRRLAPGGLLIPTLAEVLDLVRHRAYLNIELKENGNSRPAFAARLRELLCEYRVQDDVMLSSFSAPLLLACLDEPGMPPLEAALLVDHRTRRLPDRRFFSRIQYLNPDYRILLRDPDAFRAGSLPLCLWTVDSPAVCRRLAADGVLARTRFLITNDPTLPERFPGNAPEAAHA